MSELTTAARPYARAAFDIANKNGEQQQWTEMLSIMAAIAYDPTTVSYTHLTLPTTPYV